MSFLYSNLAPVFVAILISSLGWVFGGTRSGLLLQYMPWMLLFLVEIALVFPQKEHGETTQDARERVWAALKKDTFAWLALALLVLLAIPFVNKGLCPTCDAVAIRGGAEVNPPVPRLPFCVDRLQHLNVFLWFLTAVLTALTVRHALTKTGCRLMLQIVVWNGVLLAVFGFVEMAAGAPGPFWAKPPDGQPPQHFFASFGYPNMAGAYFTLLFGLAYALWRFRLEELKGKTLQELGSWAHSPHRVAAYKYDMLVAMVILFLATINTLSRAAIMLVSGLAVVCSLHTYHYFASKLARAVRVKRGIICAASLAVGLVAIYVFTPESVQREVSTLQTREVLNRVTGKNAMHSRVANQLWHDHLLFGCGGWGYRHLAARYKNAFERRESRYRGNANVHNDYLQFMAEHGAVGFALMVALVVVLLYPVSDAWRYLASVARFAPPKERPPSPISFFALPGAAFCVVMALLCVLIHAFGDCPLRSPAVMTLFVAALAAARGFLPFIPNPEDRVSRDTTEHHHHHHRHSHSQTNKEH